MSNTEMKDCGILDKLWDDIETYADAHCSGDNINIYDVAIRLSVTGRKRGMR